MKRFLLLLLAYLLWLALFWRWCHLLDIYQAAGVSLLVAALFLVAICAAFVPRGEA